MKKAAAGASRHVGRDVARCRNRPGRANRINMKTRINLVLMLALALKLIGATLTMAEQAGAGANVPPPTPKSPCGIYAATGDPCVVAHSTTRALYASYNGPLYRVLRQSDGKTDRRKDLVHGLSFGADGRVAAANLAFPETGAASLAPEAERRLASCGFLARHGMGQKHRQLRRGLD